MRYFLILTCFLCVLTCVSAALAGPIADSIAFQGRLTDASDTPVPDGPRDLIISIWTDSLAGTMVHSEMVVITTSKGLYSTCIGCGSSSFPSLFTGQTLFLQTQLSGQAAMSPRTRLRGVPSSMSSSSVNGSATHGSAVAYAILNARQAANFNPYSSMSLDLDSDGDGNNEFIITDSATPSAAVRVMSHDSDDDGLSDGDISMMMTPTTSSVAIKSKGLCCPNRARVMSQVDDTGSLHFLEADLDNDGLMDRTVSSTCDATSARLAIKTKGTSAQRLSAGGDCDDTDSEIYADCDDDNDGIAESRVSASSSSEGAAFSMHSVNDGMPNRISMNVTVPKQTQRCVISQGSDSNLDGIDETSMTSTVERKSGSIVYLDREGAEVLRSMIGVDSTKSEISASHDSDDDGVPDGEAAMIVTPTTSSVAIKTKGTGADANRTASTSSTTELGHTSTVSAVDDDGDGIPDESIEQSVSSTAVIIAMLSKKGYDFYQMAGLNSASLIIRDSIKDTTFSVDGNGRIGIGKPADAVRRIDVAGGAYCDGTNWVNASDVNSKENFEPVDGAALLERISELEITRWNYRGNTESEHIGPTAQDFQKIFGVGSDGKSISTIDPSGIALAAIKELNKQNQELKEQSQELKEQNELLKKQLNDLNAKVEKLISNK